MPQPGLLIASPQMRDAWFEKTIILLCQHDEEGAIGLVINRDGPVSIGDVVEGMEGGELAAQEPANRDAPTWWGGPVGQGAGFVVWRGVANPDEGWTVGGRVAVSPSVERLTRLVTMGTPFHLCLGYAGWGPGQLDREIREGAWLYTEVDEHLVFDTALPERFEQALALLGLTPHSIWMTPIDE